MCEKSRLCQFIDTSVISDRTRCPKLMKDLANLADDSTDIWKPDIYDKYSERHESLESVSLAVFAASYYNCKKQCSSVGDIVPRTRDRIIRYRKFKCNTEDVVEKENFYRGMLLLHLPWRDEVNDIMKPVEELSTFSSFEHMYNENINCIMTGRRRFECNIDMEIELHDEVERCVAADEQEENETDELIRRYVCGSSKYIFEENAEFMDVSSQNIDVDMPRSDSGSRRMVAAPRSRGDWTRDQLNTVIRGLNTLQKLIVLIVIHEIRLRHEPRLIFTEGSAGVGKSVVARCLANSFEMFSPNTNPGMCKCVVSAPTGKAADNIDGRTIHNVYMLAINQNKKSSVGKRIISVDDSADVGFDPLAPDSLAELQIQFCDMYGQIIDEVSMLSQSQLILIEQRCQQATGKKGKLFGGLWTIVFGDFRQLPPIGGESLMEMPKNSLVGALPLWWKFSHIELTENMRQGDDQVFARILMKIGDYEELTDEERLLIESRFVNKNNLTVPDDAVRIYATNREVDKYCSSVLLKNDSSNIVVLEARDRIEQIKTQLQFVSPSLRKKSEGRDEVILNSAKNLTISQARGLPFKLIAVVGYSYLVTKNIDTSDGLVNGAVGKLVWIEFGTIKKKCSDNVSEEVVPKKLWMKFPGKTGKMANLRSREELKCAINNSHCYKDKVYPYKLPNAPTEDDINCLVPIEREDLSLDSVWTESWRCVKRQQFPLTSALAMTVYKIQGSTKESILTYYDANMSNAEVYVSLSRVTKLSGLFIDDSKVVPDARGHYFQHPPCLSTEIEKNLMYKDLSRFKNRKHQKERYLAEKKRLLGKSISVPWQRVVDIIKRKTTFLYHNVQSLQHHMLDIMHDDIYMACDVLLLVETHLFDNENIVLGNGFTEIARSNSSSCSRSGGTIIYSKISGSSITMAKIDEIDISVAVIMNCVKIAAIYCHKKPSCKSVISCLRAVAECEPSNLSIIICGDFNLDMQAVICNELFHEMQEHIPLQLKSNCEDVTTYHDYGAASCIDGIYSTIETLEVALYQSYFSYHLPMIFTTDLKINFGI